MSKLFNYIGQLRIYSLADLMLLLYASGARLDTSGFWGAVCLWVGFLAYLESEHHNKGREQVPGMFGWLFWFMGFDLLGEKYISAIWIYIIFSIIYSQKKQKKYGLASPLMRGLQTLVIVGMFCGLKNPLPYIAGALTSLRNFSGDVRDSKEDAEERIRTWPVVFGWKSHPFVHLFGIVCTTFVWWLCSKGLSIWLLLSIWIVEIATYWITPRPSNKNAFAYTQKILRAFRR
jgi:hypothetical protein